MSVSVFIASAAHADVDVAFSKSSACPGLFTRFFKKFLTPTEAPVEEPLSFEFAPHVGTPSTVTQIGYLEMRVEGASYHELGRGGGGLVVRVVPPEGSPPFVLKNFFDLGRREIEERAMVQLEKDSKHVKTKIRFVRQVPVGQKTARLDDVRGQTLKDLLDGVTLSSAERTHLLREWNELVRGVRSRVPKGRRKIDATYKGAEVLRYSFDKKDVSGDVFLKPDNVIVESGTGRMYIIDPY